MDFVTVSTGLILPYWMGLPIRYIQFQGALVLACVMVLHLIFDLVNGAGSKICGCAMMENSVCYSKKKLYDKYCYFNFLLFDEEGIVSISRYLATVLLEI